MLISKEIKSVALTILKLQYDCLKALVSRSVKKSVEYEILKISLFFDGRVYD